MSKLSELVDEMAHDVLVLKTFQEDLLKICSTSSDVFNLEQKRDELYRKFGKNYVGRQIAIKLLTIIDEEGGIETLLTSKSKTERELGQLLCKLAK